MPPWTHDDDLDLADLRRDLHELASRWDARPADTRPDVATPSPAWRRRGRLRAWLPRVAVAAAAVAALVALAVVLLPRTAPPPPDVVEGPTPARTSEATPPGNFVGQLDRIPAGVVDDGPLLVTLDDLARAERLAGVDPARDAGEWLLGVQGAGEDTTGPFVLSTLHQDLSKWLVVPEVRAEVGWMVPDADVVTSARQVETQLGEDIPVDEPLTQGWFMVVDGVAARAAMPGTVLDGDLRRLGPDDDGPCSLEHATAARVRGCPLWFADGGTTRTVTTSRSLAAASLQDGPTLSDRAPLAAVVERLQGAGLGMPVSMTLVVPGGAGTSTTDAALPAPWLAAGVALHVADDGTREVWVAYEHATEEDAARNVAAMAGTWRDVDPQPSWDLESVEATQQGSTVLVAVSPTSTRVLLQIQHSLEQGGGPFQLG